ncbi:MULTISPECIES: hypothetical protein [unclassified Streptomyces]|uniref:hypothetical protein n=1 Tax=unclassified Streptomyces TaxID=2593676 RepID=UPI00036903D5|nr:MULTISPECIES: hypothetical protein [unclassified Streptomyces]
MHPARGRSISITPAERAGRIIVGLAGIIVGLVLLTSAGSVLAVVLEALLIAAGLDLLITGALAHRLRTWQIDEASYCRPMSCLADRRPTST